MIRIIAAATCLVVCLHAPATGGEVCVRVDDFEQAVQNRLGGYRSAFARWPSSAATLRVDNVFRGAGGRSMRVTACRKRDGFCGLWVHLFDMQQKHPRYFDARSHGFLSFWVKGKHGGESFDIKLADQHWVQRQDAVLLGHVGDFLAGGVTTQWQEVIVPLQTRQIDLSRLGGVTFDFAVPGDFVVYIDDIAFKSAADVVSPETLTLNSPARTSQRTPHTIWLWSSKELLRQRDRWDELFRFCQTQNVNQIWMQLPYAMVPATSEGAARPPAAGAPAPRCVIHLQPALRAFLRLAHRHRLRVHALDGAPEYCLKSQHSIPLSVVDAVIAMNRRGQPDERFDGIHFDNEPHLLIAWTSRPQREQILREFLSLNAECQKRVRENSSMQYGIDIPFWWQAKDEASGQCLGSVYFRGVRKAASYHCIDMLDNVGVMNYRDTADGADGMMAHARDLLVYADRRRGATMYMGVETFRYENTPVWFCVGLPRVEFDEAVRRTASLAGCSRVAGHRVRTLDDGQFVHLGIELPASADDAERAAAERALRTLAAAFGMATGGTQVAAAERARQCAKRAIDGDSQWQGFQVRDLPAGESAGAIAGFQTESVMLSKVSFADNSYADFTEQTEAAVDYFRSFSSYAGLAIHFYETFRALCSSETVRRGSMVPVMTNEPILPVETAEPVVSRP